MFAMSACTVREHEEPHYHLSGIRRADPLHADALLARLPAMNAAADTPELTRTLRTLTPAPETTATWNTVECLAAMRDLGLVLGSLKRHSVEPCHALPETLPALRELARRTRMIPRDTVHHYTAWNPVGPRQRTYTGDPVERHLQEAVRTVFPNLVAALAACEELTGLEPYDPRFAQVLDTLAALVQAMVDSIDFTIAHVPPAFFARVLRPYFEEIDVDGTDYLGPAAAQVPLWLVDLVLWQSDRSGPEYDGFLAASVPYSLPAWRSFHRRHAGGLSAVSKLRAAIGWESRDRLPETLHASATSLTRVLRQLKTFRARHLGIAKKAYHQEVRLYETGSGGAPVALLRSVLDLTRENETLIRHSLRRRPATS